MFLGEKEIASSGEKLFKGDTCQGWPMGIDSSVPVGSAIMPKTPIGSWAYLLYLPLLSRKEAVRHTFTAEQDGEEVVLLARVEAATGNTLEGISPDKSNLLPAHQSSRCFCWRNGYPREPVSRTFFGALTTSDPWCRA